jgi:hypothetical protein
VVTLAAPARVNVNQPNAVTSQVNSTSSALTYKWALLQGPPGFALNASTLASAATLDTANLVVRRGALAVGLQYTVQLTVTDENGFTGTCVCGRACALEADVCVCCFIFQVLHRRQ